MPPSGHGTGPASPSRSRTGRRRPCPSVRSPRNPSSSGEFGTVVDRMVVATGGVRLPDLDHPVGHRLARAVEQHAADLDRPRVGRVDDVGRDQRRAADRSPGTGRRSATATGPGSVIVRLLERRRLAAAEHDVEAVAERPSGSVSSRSRRLTSRSRARSSRIELKIGSNANSGSPGKYICVTSRSVNARPKSEKWMWLGRHAFGGSPTDTRRA